MVANKWALASLWNINTVFAGIAAMMAGLMLTVPQSVAQDKEEELKTTDVSFGPATYPVPSSWKEQKPSNSMRVAQYLIPNAKDEKGKVELVVFYFGGGGGSVDSNLKRWVGQFQKVKGEPKKETFKADGMAVTTLDATGTYEVKPFPMAARGVPKDGYRMLAAIVETEKGSYFFKLVGPDTTVGPQAKGFMNMFKNAKKK